MKLLNLNNTITILLEKCKKKKKLIAKGITNKKASEILKGKSKKTGDGTGPYEDGKGPHGNRNRMLEEEFYEASQLLNEEWYDAYRDFKGQGMTDAEARAAANKMYGGKSSSGTNIKTPVLEYMRFYKIKPEEEQKAKSLGLKQSKNGKWYIGIYNTSGVKTTNLINDADEMFGKGTNWKPNK